MIRLLKSKKADIGKDMFAAIAALVLIIFMFIIGYIIGTATLDQMAVQFTGSSQAIFAISKFRLTYTLLDKIVIIIAASFVAAIAYLNYKIASRPVFIILNFIMAAFYMFISYTFNFIIEEMFKIEVIQNVRSAFPASYLMGTNFHWLALVMFIAGIIALYGKKEKGQFLA